MTRKSIAIDMDEVLADTVGALIEDVNKRTDLGITYDMLDGKKLRHAMPEHDGLLHEILREPGFFKKLKVMAHSQKVVKKLTEHYDVFIATDVMDVPTSFHDQYAWLRAYFAVSARLHFVFCGRKDIGNADYLIDDKPPQLAIFTGKSIMYTASHNVNDDRFTRVNNWYDVEQYLLGDSEYNI